MAAESSMRDIDYQGIIHNNRIAQKTVKLGWVEGLEPSISRATTWRVKPLHYTHHEKQVIIISSRIIISNISITFNDKL